MYSNLAYIQKDLLEYIFFSLPVFFTRFNEMNAHINVNSLTKNLVDLLFYSFKNIC